MLTHRTNEVVVLFVVIEMFRKKGILDVHSYDIDPHSYDVDPLEEGRAFKEQSLFACKQAAA